MATPEKKPIEPGMLARAVAGVRYMLTGKSPDEWFGPSQPMLPQAQQLANGRQFDFPVGYNLVQQPRSSEQIGFSELRSLADSCDLVRLAVETRKDQMCRLEWQILPRDEDKEADDRCKQLTDFFQFPDREHDWLTWLRMVLEDLLVIDAPTIYPRMTRGGGVYSLDLIDGSTIKRVLNADGRTPVAPDPAYQQILKGLPAVDYSRDELLYVPRNPRTNRVYGFSPVEQIVLTINIALRRNLSQLAYYTEGNIPEALYTVPEGWAPAQIKQFQEYWDAMLEGNIAAKRHAKFVPNGVQALATRDPKLKDEYDEWLARVICFCFSLPPTALVKQVNRATGEQAQDTADEEGVAPTMQWVMGAMNQVIGRWFGFPDLQFSWKEEEAQDPKTQAEVNKIYLDAKVITPDEVRADLGREPLTAEQKDELAPTLPMVGPDGKPLPPGKTPISTEEKPPPAAAEKLSKKKASSRSTVIAKRLLVRGQRFAKY